MLDIIVPMAGRGSRLLEAGYKDPKALINVHGKEAVINNLKPSCEHRFISVCQEEYVYAYQLEGVFSNTCENYKIIKL